MGDSEDLNKDQTSAESQESLSSSLETPETFVEQQPQTISPEVKPEDTGNVVSQAPLSEANKVPAKSHKLKDRFANMRKSLNIYLLIFGLVVLLAVIITFVAYQRNNQSSSNQGPAGQAEEINQGVLDQLRNSDVKLGDPKQILSVEANAVFAGTVLIKGDFEVAGQIRSGGPISGSSINIAGAGTFQSLQTSGLQLAGNGEIQGNLSVQNNLTVSGSGNFGGTLSAAKLSIQSLELAGDLVISNHIDASGGTPSKSDGNALGGGGTSSVSGTDTAGTININTGGGPPAGCFVTINFAKRFNSTPHVVISPIGSPGASLAYYVNKSSNGFSVCTASTPPAGQNFAFDYIVIN